MAERRVGRRIIPAVTTMRTRERPQQIYSGGPGWGAIARWPSRLFNFINQAD